jgi:hypothetical protein
MGRVAISVTQSAATVENATMIEGYASVSKVSMAVLVKNKKKWRQEIIEGQSALSNNHIHLRLEAPDFRSP